MSEKRSPNNKLSRERRTLPSSLFSGGEGHKVTYYLHATRSFPIQQDLKF
jgi:hypothetical protein